MNFLCLNDPQTLNLYSYVRNRPTVSVDPDGHDCIYFSSAGTKLLHTVVLSPGPKGTEQMSPYEPRVLGDGKTVLIQTRSCGLYAMNGIDSDHPSVRHAKTFEGERCGVPLSINHYWVPVPGSISDVSGS